MQQLPQILPSSSSPRSARQPDRSFVTGPPRVNLTRSREDARARILTPRAPPPLPNADLAASAGEEAERSESQQTQSHNAALVDLAEGVLEALPHVRRSLRRSLVRRSITSEDALLKFQRPPTVSRVADGGGGGSTDSTSGALSGSLMETLERTKEARQHRRRTHHERAMSILSDANFPAGRRRRWPDIHMSNLREWHLNREVERVPDAELDAYLADLVHELKETEALVHLTLAKFPLGNSRVRIAALCYHGLNQTRSLLSSLRLTDCEMGPTAFLMLCEFLSTTQNQRGLGTLDVSYNLLDFRCVEYLSICLRSTNITSISLHGNPLGNEAAQPLADLLAECHRLTHLDVGRCKIDTNAIGPLLAAVPSAPALQSLNLDAVGLNAPAAMQLLRGVEESKTITDISLRFNETCSQRVWRERLEAVLMRNRRLNGDRSGSLFAASSLTRTIGANNSMWAGGASFFAALRGGDLLSQETMRMDTALAEGYHVYTTNAPSLAKRAANGGGPGGGGAGGGGLRIAFGESASSMSVSDA